ncbi:hypothetical protein DN401_12615 [Bacillus sp. BF2-3]|nr:hypothetical protein DN401_12615 [Bacillus sp. BF2-3]
MLGARTGQGDSTSTDSSKDNSEARGKDRAWHTTRGEEQTNETTMKEQRKKNERRTKTNDNSKISVANGSNEPCRELATPDIFLYMDTPHHRGAGGVYRGGLVTAMYTPQF